MHSRMYMITTSRGAIKQVVCNQTIAIKVYMIVRAIDFSRNLYKRSLDTKIWNCSDSTLLVSS